MILNVPQKDVVNYKALSGKAFLNNGTFYKICDKEYRDEYEINDFLNFVYSIPNIDGLMGPDDLLKDQYIYGYARKFVKKADTLAVYVINQLSDERKAILVNQMIAVFKKIHENFIFGDIRLDNFLIVKDKLYVIDFENGKRLNDDNYLLTYYEALKGSNYPDNIMNDLLKMYISILSIIFNNDLEYVYISYGLDFLRDYLKMYANTYDLLIYLDFLIDSLKNNYINPVYFDDVVNNLNSSKIQKLVKKIH